MKQLYFLLAAIFTLGNAAAQIVTIPDPNFKSKLLAANTTNWLIAKNSGGAYIKIDANSDGEIQVTEATAVYSMKLFNYLIPDITGITAFTNLRNLDCSYNLLTTIDLTGLTYLETLDFTSNSIGTFNASVFPNLQTLMCGNNHLMTLDVHELASLQTLFCSGNQLTSLDAGNLLSLETLNCAVNALTSLNMTGSTHLFAMYCDSNQLTSLNFNGLSNLTIITCGMNQFQSIDLTGLSAVRNFDIRANQLTSIDLSPAPNLEQLDIEGNNFTTINVENASKLTNLNVHNNPIVSVFMKTGRYISLYTWINPQLEYVCADEENIANVESNLEFNGTTTCHVNSYCSFTPGGTFYRIAGNTKVDYNENGCDVGDIDYANLKFHFSDGFNTADLIADESGSYHYDVQEGTQTITPILENPTYFVISPTTATVTFPTVSSPFTQNFCVSANGTINDLEVVLLPITAARPGFNVWYELIYRNKGNRTQSGTVSVAFNDSLLDFVSANPTVDAQAINYLNWNFTDLQPFETRTIKFILNANSPIETPPVFAGTVLHFTASVNGNLGVEVTPADNTFLFDQTVVNSFDPNDKTCLEGLTVSEDMVGKDVHYMIRFENTGTFPADNIVVTDRIDTDKFDIASLVPLIGSHHYVTKISDTNKVEFIFESINLPFDDANNDGYVAFKIKTKSTLTIGESFSNEANIYFDYNAPILTNQVVTTIGALANADFAFDRYFKIHPNPANAVLNIELKKEITITSISIYNTLGQLVEVIPNAQSVKTVDVSNLKTGNYFMKVLTDKGTSNVRFVKN